jgi:hypothetical protein
VDGRNKSGHDDGTAAPRGDTETKPTHAAANFFITFVDATFTILVERLFTKLFEAIAPTATFPCVYRACNSD